MGRFTDTATTGLILLSPILSGSRCRMDRRANSRSQIPSPNTRGTIGIIDSDETNCRADQSVEVDSEWACWEPECVAGMLPQQYDCPTQANHRLEWATRRQVGTALYLGF